MQNRGADPRQERLERLQGRLARLEERLASSEPHTCGVWATLSSRIPLLLTLLLIGVVVGAATHVKGGDLEVHSVTAAAGSDSYMIKIWGQSSASQKEMTLQNIAEAGTDDYRLAILNAGAATEIVTVDDDGFVGIMNTRPSNALDVIGDVNISGGGLKGCVLYAELDTEGSSISSTFADRVTLTLPAGGTYIVFASCDLDNTGYADGTEVRFRNTSTSTNLSDDPISPYTPWASTYEVSRFWVKEVVVDGTDDVVAIQWAGRYALIRFARIIAIRID